MTTVADLMRELNRLPMTAKIGVLVEHKDAQQVRDDDDGTHFQITSIEPASRGAMQGISAMDWRLTLGGEL